VLRYFVGACALLLFVQPLAAADPPADGSVIVTEPMQLLFAQSARGMTFDGKVLTLKDPAPATVFFADRPQRLTGHFSNADFVELWSQGADSFAADPPNAALSLLEEGDAPPRIVEIEGVSLEDGALRYRVRVLEGEIPAAAGPVSLFIDPWVYVPPRGPRPGWMHCHWNRWGTRVCGRYW